MKYNFDSVSFHPEMNTAIDLTMRVSMQIAKVVAMKREEAICAAASSRGLTVEMLAGRHCVEWVTLANDFNQETPTLFEHLRVDGVIIGTLKGTFQTESRGLVFGVEFIWYNVR